jgi:hypothetical protein
MVYRPADRLLAHAFFIILHILAETMTTSFQKALAVLASVASVLADPPSPNKKSVTAIFAVLSMWLFAIDTLSRLVT